MAKRNPHPKLPHKYHRITLKFGQVWACARANCAHHMPEHLTPTVIGKLSSCWKCDAEFILDEENMKNEKPICANCDDNKVPISSFLESLGVK